MNDKISEAFCLIAELAVNFGSEINNDPADKIVAAIIHSAQLVTADENLRACEWLDTVAKSNIFSGLAPRRYDFW